MSHDNPQAAERERVRQLTAERIESMEQARGYLIDAIDELRWADYGFIRENLNAELSLLQGELEKLRKK